jgi:hypothetical protein
MMTEVICLGDAEKLRALPDGEYKTNDIAPMFFRKEAGKIVLRNGKTKTLEEFVGRFRTIRGPLPE